MQPQINAIKQLLETNSITASQIEEILVKALGQQASWENSSTMSELAYLEDRFCDDQEEISPEIRWILALLWRSRIDLNDARINAEEVDLEEFLIILKGSIAEYRIKDDLDVKNLISLMETEIGSLRIDVKERSRDISSLKTQVRELEAALELANSKAIAPNLDAFKGAVNEAVNPVLIEKIEERDHEIERLKAQLEFTQSQVRGRDKTSDELRGVIEQNKEAFAKELRASLDLIAKRDREIDRLSNEVRLTVSQFLENISDLAKARDACFSEYRAYLGLPDNGSEQEISMGILKLKQTITDRDRTILELELALKSSVDAQIAKDPERFRIIADDIMLTKLAERAVKLEERDHTINDLLNQIDSFDGALNVKNERIASRDRQIQELQITVKNHHEQFDALKSHFEVLLKAIAMNLNALKGARKPDQTKEVDGVMVTFRNYDDNLTHHHKTIIIENQQRAIAEEAKKLKCANLKDFSFDH